MRILLIEDDHPLADGLQRALRHSGHAVDWAGTGAEAESLLAAQEYDIVLLDLGLPDIDGGELLSRLREKRQRTPVLVLSAREATLERVRLLDLGADDYLVKPVALSELEARIRAITRRAAGTAEVLMQVGRLTLDLSGRRAWCDKTAFDLTALLRGNFTTRAKSYREARQGGWLTANEIRRGEGYEDHPEGDQLQKTPVGGAPNPGAGESQ